MKYCEIQPTYYLAVLSIANNEGIYIKEWLEWHKKYGVEKFFIYDNGSTNNTYEVLRPYIESGVVESIYFPGKQQLAAYDDCFEKHRTEARWIAVINLDEFIVPIKDKTIPEFLHRIENYSSIEINWLIYGSSRAKIREQGDVMKRFREHSLPDHKLNRHVKSIVNPRRICTMIGCHEAARISGKSVDSHGNPLKKRFRDCSP